MRSKNFFSDPPAFVTCSLFAIGLIVALKTEESLTLYEWAQYWASLVSAGALVWLVSGYWQQSKSIDIQNKNIRIQTDQLELNRLELTNQQRQLELQQAELKKMSDSFALSHLREMVTRAKRDYSKDKSSSISYAHETLPDILKSEDPQTVSNACSDWMENYKHYLLYITRLRDAAEFYLSTNGTPYNADIKSNDQFLFVHRPLLAKTPYIGDALNLIAMRIEMNAHTIDIPEIANLAMLSAHWFLTPDIVKPEELHKSAQNFNDKQLPAIYKKLKQLEPND